MSNELREAWEEWNYAQDAVKHARTALRTATMEYDSALYHLMQIQLKIKCLSTDQNK